MRRRKGGSRTEREEDPEEEEEGQEVRLTFLQPFVLLLFLFRSRVFPT